MKLVITVGGTAIEIVQPGVDGEYPYLSKVGVLLLAARAGHLQGVGVGESANMTVELINDARQSSNLLGYCLRAPASLTDDNGDPFFSGLVQRMGLGTVLILTIEA